MSSWVARSTTNGTMPSSKIRRASVTSSEVSGDRLIRSARPDPTWSDVGLVTNAPPRAPTRMVMSPPASSTLSASRTVTRETPNRWHRSRSLGSWSPGVSVPSRMRALIWSTMACDARVMCTVENMSFFCSLDLGFWRPRGGDVLLIGACSHRKD